MPNLMNVDIECPKEFFIFCDQCRPMTIHNLKVTKTFTSAAFANCSINNDFSKKYEEGSVNYLPFLPAKPDCDVVSPFCLTAMNDYRIEYDAEVCRKMYYPKYPSRLSAVFAFGDYETCKNVADKHGNGWDLSTVKKFKLIEHPSTRVIRVNMEIVSLARHAYIMSYLNENDLNILWNYYWNGRGNFQMELPDANLKRTIRVRVNFLNI